MRIISALVLLFAAFTVAVPVAEPNAEKLEAIPRDFPDPENCCLWSGSPGRVLKHSNAPIVEAPGAWMELIAGLEDRQPCT